MIALFIIIAREPIHYPKSYAPKNYYTQRCSYKIDRIIDIRGSSVMNQSPRSTSWVFQYNIFNYKLTWIEEWETISLFSQPPMNH